jgi:hypothetical protein
MGILDQQIIRGIKNTYKNKPTFNDGRFDKTQPIGPHNMPLSSRALYKIYGYKIDAAGMKRPYWMEKAIPTGRALTPKMCGLDGFYDVKCTKQYM